MDIDCIVVAPTLIPRRAGDRIKTDRRDALRLAQLLRAGELTPVWTPDEDHEALRDLIRARHDAKEDLQRARQRLHHFLLRHDLRPPQGMRNWTVKHRDWMNSLTFEKFEKTSLRIVFQEYLHSIDEITERMKRIESEIHEQAIKSEHAPVIQALQAMRGVADVTAVTLVAEIGQFSRFTSPRQLMSYAGLVPKEYSSGSSRWQGSITKIGNAQIRRVLVESA
jgi:transposase